MRSCGRGKAIGTKLCRFPVLLTGLLGFDPFTTWRVPSPFSWAHLPPPPFFTYTSKRLMHRVPDGKLFSTMVSVFTLKVERILIVHLRWFSENFKSFLV